MKLNCSIALVGFLIANLLLFAELSFADGRIAKEPNDKRACSLDAGISAIGVLNSLAEMRALSQPRHSTILIRGYYITGDGGGGHYYLDCFDKGSKENGGSIVVAEDGNRWKLVPSGTISVKQFGARGDGKTDDSAAFAAALAAHTVVHVPAGYYRITGGLTLSRDGAKLRGDGVTATKIAITTSEKVGISINAGLNNVEIGGFTLTRSVVAESGAYGIDSTAVTIGQALFRDLVLEKHYRNLGLGATDYSTVRNVISQDAVNAGIYLTNTKKDGTCQWTLDSVLSQRNGAQGLVFVALAGPIQVTLGAWKDLSTFANSGNGIAVNGLPTVPVHGVRIFGGFFGEDGNSELYLDTYGGQHQITGAFVELAGRGKTGAGLLTPASNVGYGVEVTSNNVNIQLTGVHANGSSFDGFHLNSSSSILGNSRATNNGLARIAGRRNGAISSVGRLTVNGGDYGNTGAGNSQQYGVFAADGNNVTIFGANLRGNAIAAYGAAKNANSLQAVGNSEIDKLKVISIPNIR